MAREFEDPISNLIAGGDKAVFEHVTREGPWLLFRWLALILFKTHLKDRSLRFNLDKRQGAEKISELYDWEEMHHIHCIARSFYTGAQLDPTVFGSVLML